MIQVLIAVAAFSLQISGAVLLLVWYLAGAHDKIIRMSAGDSRSVFWGAAVADTRNGILPKEVLQKNASVYYRNAMAVADIIVGLVCAIFVNAASTSPYMVFTFTCFATLAILAGEYTGARYLAKLRYPGDMSIKGTAYAQKQTYAQPVQRKTSPQPAAEPQAAPQLLEEPEQQDDGYVPADGELEEMEGTGGMQQGPVLVQSQNQNQTPAAISRWHKMSASG